MDRDADAVERRAGSGGDRRRSGHLSLAVDIAHGDADRLPPGTQLGGDGCGAGKCVPDLREAGLAAHPAAEDPRAGTASGHTGTASSQRLVSSVSYRSGQPPSERAGRRGTQRLTPDRLVYQWWCEQHARPGGQEIGPEGNQPVAIPGVAGQHERDIQGE